MPIYEYECPRCSCRFEQKRNFSDNSPAFCPECQCEARHIFSPVPIIFKGSGFYTTDHRGNHGHSAPTGGSGEAKAGDADKAKVGTTDEAKADSAEQTS